MEDMLIGEEEEHSFYLRSPLRYLALTILRQLREDYRGETTGYSISKKYSLYRKAREFVQNGGVMSWARLAEIDASEYIASLDNPPIDTSWVPKPKKRKKKKKKVKKRREWSEEEVEFLLVSKKRLTESEIAAKLSRPICSVHSKIYQLGKSKEGRDNGKI